MEVEGAAAEAAAVTMEVEKVAAATAVTMEVEKVTAAAAAAAAVAMEVDTT
jgi:hypothetical protein